MSCFLPASTTTDPQTHQLLETPINQTLSNLSQALQFLVENDFLDGVELNPGEYEEAMAHGAAQTENLVQILDTDPKPIQSSVSVLEPTTGAANVEEASEEPRARGEAANHREADGGGIDEPLLEGEVPAVSS